MVNDKIVHKCRRVNGLVGRGVMDTDQPESLCRRGGAGVSAVFVRKDPGNLFRQHFCLSDLDQCPHDVPDHVVEKRFGLEGKSNDILVRYPGDIQSLQSSDRTFCPAFRCAKRGEVMSPEEKMSGLLHRL